jgi:predicted MFS family arabinose efflux permease
VVGFLLGFLTWRAILQGVLLPALLCGGLIWLALRTVPTRQEGVSGLGEYVGSMRRLLRNRRLLLVLLLSGGFSAGQSAVMTFLPIHLEEGMGVSPLERGFYLSLAQVAGIGTQPVMGYLSDRWGRKAVLVPGLTVLGLSYLGLALAPIGWPFTLVVLVMGAFLFSLMAIFLASASDLAEGSAQAATVSLVFGAGVVVAGVSPAVAGLIADAFGITAAFLWASGAVLLTAFVAAVTRWQKTPA